MIRWLSVLSLLVVNGALLGQSCGPGGCPQPGTPGSRAPGVPSAPQRVAAPGRAIAASVKVSVWDGRGISGGSGTHLGHGIFLTNRHVGQRQSNRASVSFANGESFNGWVMLVCSYADLAAIECPPASGQTTVELSDRLPATGESVWKVGYPASAGRRLDTNNGPMRGSLQVEWGRSNEILMHCSSGDSGGGIFNRDGKLCGVLWGGDGQHTTAVTYADTKRFWEECCRLRGKQPVPPAQPIPAPPTDSGPLPPVVPIAPVQPPVGPVAPMQPTSPDLASILAKLDALDRKVASIPAGPTGPAGKDGIGIAGPPGPAGRDADTSAIEAKLADINVKLDAAMQRPMTPGPAGKDGKDGVGIAGPPGAAGKDGLPGPVGQVPQAAIDAIKADLMKQGFQVDILDSNGQVVQSQQVHLGGVLRLQLQPVVKSTGK